MDLYEIVHRAPELPLEQDEAIYVIKEYIKARKGLNITPIITSEVPNIFTAFEFQKFKLMLAAALTWFRLNPESIINQ